ncbi:MAG: HAD family hydrolase [Candidatus Njordarchaeota archaeon]
MRAKYNSLKYSLYITDVDGVLVNSYSCLFDAYSEVARKLGLKENSIDKFVNIAIRMEDLADAEGNYDRSTWWPSLFSQFGLNINKDALMEAILYFWRLRSINSEVLPYVYDILKFLKQCGLSLVILAGNDGVKGLKQKRIENLGLESYFDDILIVGDNVVDRQTAIRYLSQKYGVGYSEMIFVDDKPAPIREVENFDGILTIRVKYKGPLRLAWEGECGSAYEVESTEELYFLLKKILNCE